MKGNIHSMESMGLVDGPGIRTVIFMQGCRLRCAYCHNPDTWAVHGGKQMEASALVKKISRFKPYFGTDGGVTFSGGEPLMQPEFLLECLKLCKEAGIHTCLDTAGQARLDVAQGLLACDADAHALMNDILAHTDLILFDVKHCNPASYEALTKGTLSYAEHFLHLAEKMNVPLWVRHVVVPNLTDQSTHLTQLEDYIQHIAGVKKIQLLAYHRAGENKYAQMGIAYPLQGTPAMDVVKTNVYETKLRNAIHCCTEAANETKAQ